MLLAHFSRIIRPPVLSALLSTTFAAGGFGASQADSFFTSSDGVRIRYTERGSGPPVLLLHGFIGSSQTSFESPGVVTALAKTFRVIAMDIRGHGRSDKPHDRTRYGAALLDDVTRLLDHLSIQKIDVVGFSMGGELALAYAMNTPRRLRKVVVSGAGLVTKDDTKQRLWKTHGELLAKPGASVGHLEFPGTKLDAAAIATFDRMNDLRALSAAALGMLSLHIDEARIRANEVPILFLIGELDAFKPAADAAMAIGRNVSMVVLPGRGHGDARSDPSYAATIESFLLK